MFKENASKKIEFGDFQTPLSLAKRSIDIVARFIDPDFVLEPTCGTGHFLEASFKKWKNKAKYKGYEINKKHIQDFYRRLPEAQRSISVEWRDFFSTNIEQVFARSKFPLVVGNPPWVTNSQLGTLDSDNLPKKSNIDKLAGIEAIMGKSNFDISEWIITKIIEELFLSKKGVLAMLCKTNVARSVFLHNNRNGYKNVGYKIFKIDSNKEFKVSVDACLFMCDVLNGGDASICEIYSTLNAKNLHSRIGIDHNDIIANIDLHKKTKSLAQGKSDNLWRSGVKHDASKIMELSLGNNGECVNGFGEIVKVEDKYLYPLLKSSDLANSRLTPRKLVIMTQKKAGEDTSGIKEMAPKLWRYLESHRAKLDNRKSTIYKNKPRFSMFGVGDYSYKPYKIAISGLYKRIHFCLLKTFKSKPIMLDDTCYFLGFDSLKESDECLNVLKSTLVSDYVSSLVFWDSKRPINSEILRSIDIRKILKHCNDYEPSPRW